MLAVGTLLVTATVLLPWSRNRAFVRSFFDYGLIIAGVTRIGEGERPYVDFTTPNQTGAFLFDLAAERLGGGTYQAMTLGAGVLIVLSTCALVLQLARHWPPIPSLTVAGAIVCAGVSQHTIIWYNSVGVVCLALVAWGGAQAPVLRRESAWCHAALGAALLVGGITKLNFQLVALAVAMGWALRAGWTRRASWRRVGATLVFLGVFGAVLPVAGELAWTGATPALWWHNTVGMAAPERAGVLAATFKPAFYLRPIHDYYGQLRLPQAGLLGVLLTLWTVGAALRRGWAERDRRDRWLPLVGGLLAGGGGAALLATNYEIAYVGLAAWLALVVGLWLGFALPARGPAFYGGLVVPALLVAAVSWDSAWQGQRSQFGYSSSPRRAYRMGSSAGPEFAYLKGTFLPPEECDSLGVLAELYRTQPPVKGVLYGPGLEWLERAWPVAKVPRLPLAIRWGSTCGPQESAALAAALRPEGGLQTVFVSLPQDLWRDESGAVLERWYTRIHLAAQIVRYDRPNSRPMPEKPIDFLNQFGGNVDSRLLFSWMDARKDGRGRNFLGITRGFGALTMAAPSLRAESEAVLRRLGAGAARAVTARFWVNAQRADGNEGKRWEALVELAAGQSEVVVPSGEVDGGGAPLVFRVSVPEADAGQVVAGWRAPTITHVAAGASDPPSLQGSTLPEVPIDTAGLAALFPAGWRPAQIVARGGNLTGAGFELPPGGEVWVRVPGSLAEYSGYARAAPGGAAGVLPVVRIVWGKSGRIQIENQAVLGETDRAMEFRAWSAEPDGWFGIIVDQDPANAVSVVVRVTKVTPSG